jgi:hypothetical protein
MAEAGQSDRRQVRSPVIPTFILIPPAVVVAWALAPWTSNEANGRSPSKLLPAVAVGFAILQVCLRLG